MNPQRANLLLLFFCLFSLAEFPTHAATGQPMGGMDLPMDMSSTIKGVLFPRADEDPNSRVTCTIWRVYDPVFVPPPDMIVLGIVDFNDWPEAGCPSAEFEKAVKESCIESNLKEFTSKTDEKDAKVTHIEMSVRSAISGPNGLPRDCIDNAIMKFMKVEKGISCRDDAF